MSFEYTNGMQQPLGSIPAATQTGLTPTSPLTNIQQAQPGFDMNALMQRPDYSNSPFQYSMLPPIQYGMRPPGLMNDTPFNPYVPNGLGLQAHLPPPFANLPPVNNPLPMPQTPLAQAPVQTQVMPPMPPAAPVQPTGPTPSTLNQIRQQIDNLQDQRRNVGFSGENYGQQMSDLRHQYNAQRQAENQQSNPARPVVPLRPVR